MPLVPKRRGHVHLLRLGGNPCLLEHDCKAPLLGQHAGDEVLLIGTGRRPPASSECVPEKPVRPDEAVAQVPGEEPEGVARCVLLESAVPCRPRLAGQPGLLLAKTPGRPPSGAHGRGIQPRGNPPATSRQEGAPVPADRHGSGQPARLRVAVGRGGGTTAAGPLYPPAVVLTHRRPGPWHQSCQESFPTAPTSRRGPAPQPTGGGGLGMVAGRERPPGPVLPPNVGPGAASRRRHGNRGMGGDRAGHGVQITAAAPQLMQSPPACNRLLGAVPPLVPRHALTRDVWRNILSHPRE